MFKNILSILIIGFLVSCNAYCIGFYAAGKAIGTSTCKESKESKKELYLIIQSSHKATIEKNNVPCGTFKLTLYDVPQSAIAFTQRPIRKVELITLGKLLHLWNNGDPDGFTKNPPNAAINAFVEDSGSEDHMNFFVQLTDPVYDAQKRTLTYVIIPMDGSPTSSTPSKCRTRPSSCIIAWLMAALRASRAGGGSCCARRCPPRPVPRTASVRGSRDTRRPVGARRGNRISTTAGSRRGRP